MDASRAQTSSVRWRWIALFWCAGALFEACQSIFMFHSEGKQHGELTLLGTEFTKWLPWALATPFVIRLARRFPILRTPTWTGVAAHLLTLVCITVVAEGWSATLQMTFNPWRNKHWPEFWGTLSTTIIYQALNCLVAYALILTLTYLVDSRASIERQTIETARLNEELSNAQLAALRRQMEPHFMFNALNSIAGLVRDNANAAAVKMIVGLSEFLRRAAADANRQQVPLADEVEYLRQYIDIQKVRFGDRLDIKLDIKPDTLGVAVPSLLLQPLVENAIKHGVGSRAAGGRVRIKSARSGSMLQLSIYNDGPAFPADWESKTSGVGLANLRTRLKILHGDAAALEARSIDAEGAEVVATLPWVEA